MPAMRIGSRVKRLDDHTKMPRLGTIIAEHGLAVVTVRWDQPIPGSKARHQLLHRAELQVIQPAKEAVSVREPEPV